MCVLHTLSRFLPVGTSRVRADSSSYAKKDASDVVCGHKTTKIVKVPVLRVPLLLALGTLWTGGTQSFWPPRYPEDWRNSVLSATRYPVDWRDSSPFGPQVP